ncbi:MAG: ABC transporter substrate-binding protein [Verrucomicrobiae bacterium]
MKTIPNNIPRNKGKLLSGKRKIRGALAMLLSALSVQGVWAAETIRVAIGTQDTTINCAAGGPLVRELKLLEKYLPHDGKYRDVVYDIQWESQPTGGQLNSKILNNQLDIVQMADFPSVIGAIAFDKAGTSVRSLYIATLSGGISGAGNAILVPTGSPVQSLSELKGKTISVPFVSTAHAMLLRAIQDLGWDPNKDVTIINQTPEVAGSALKAGQIDAHANFVPFGELFPFRGFARKIYDGSSTKVTTTHGIQTRSDFAEKHPEIVVAYLKATLEADRLYREDPEGYSEKLAKWTGIEPEVYYAFHGPQGIQSRDYTLKPEFVAAIKQAAETAKVLKKVDQDLDISKFVDDRFIRQAAKEFGYDYDARLKDYSPLPLAGKDFASGEKITDPKAAGQIWVTGESKVRLYKSVRGTFDALAQLEKEGKTARVTFVHDRETGLKLFADKVWYARSGRNLAAFLEKPKAEAWAKEHGGEVVAYSDARKPGTEPRPAKASR